MLYDERKCFNAISLGIFVITNYKTKNIELFYVPEIYEGSVLLKSLHRFMEFWAERPYTKISLKDN